MSLNRTTGALLNRRDANHAEMASRFFFGALFASLRLWLTPGVWWWLRSLAICIFLLLPSSVGAARLPLTITEDAGVERKNGIVTSGVPFAQGALKTNTQVRLVDERGKEVPLQAQATATWRDGSVKWLLLDFRSDVGARATRQFDLEYGEGVSLSAATEGVKIEEAPQKLWINTGPLKFAVSKTDFGLLQPAFLDRNHNGQFETDERVAFGCAAAFEVQGKSRANTLLPPSEVTVEEAGPERVVVKVAGWFNDPDGKTNAPSMQYLFRIHAYAGSSLVNVQFTATRLANTNAILPVTRLTLGLHCVPGQGAPNCEFGGQGRVHASRVGALTAELRQLSESHYTVATGTGPDQEGLRSPGWAHWHDDRGGVLLATRFFWQQFPKALRISKDAIEVDLYDGQGGKPFDWDQGLAKTHEMLFDFHSGAMSSAACAQRVAAFDHPLFAIAPTKWYCDSKVFGDLLPFDLDRFPDYETLTEASGDQFIKKMATGWRNWGDVYYGGEYKGTNSYMNLEYDVHHNFFCQFARTGLRKYLDTGLTMARHQADIDTNHKTGWQWKHSPRHVEIQAEFGHTFTRGLLESYFLTGNRRCREAAIELGNYFARQIRNPRELGNERQIGWSLISLLPVYEATWDNKYFAAAKETVDRLLAGLDDRGKFSIRWDNRISFFNGIAATGLIYYYRATGDERVAEAALKVIHRARGFYPEYAGRTLEAIAWAYQRAPEPADLDFLERTWETTLAKMINWNVMELGAPTIFTVHSLPFIAESGFIPTPEKPLRLTPEQFDTANGLYAHHLPAGEADLFFKSDGSAPFDLVIIRKGAWKASGSATLSDPAGTVVATLDFPKEGVIWQRKVVPVKAPMAGAYRLNMRSATVVNVKGGSFVTWDVVTSRPMPAVFSSSGHRGLEFVTPYLFTKPQSDSARIEIDLAGEGEGFKKAVIFDPDGNAAGSMEAFIDLGDKKRYEYKVSAEIPASQKGGIWSISLQEVSATRISGVSPYFSTSKQSFFSP